MKKIVLFGIALLFLPIVFSAPDTTNLVGYWRAEGNGTNEVNNTNYFNNASTAYTAGGRNGQALNVIAGNAFNSQSFEFPDDNVFSLYFYLNCTSPPTSPNRALNWKDTGTNNYLQLYNYGYVDYANSANHFCYFNQSPWGNATGHDNYTSIVAVKNGASFKTYYNGTAICSATFGTFTYNLDSFTIGGDTAATNKASCHIDEISIYSAAHTEEEVNQQINRFYPFAASAPDTTPPIITYINCTSCYTDTTPETAPYQTNDTTPTFNITTNEAAVCAIADVNLNYTAMVSEDSLRNCTPTGGTQHFCTLQPSDALILNETDYVYVGCKDSSGNGNKTSSSGPLEISLQQVEVHSEEAIQAGIEASVIWPGAAVHTNQQVYLRSSNNNQLRGTFDKLAVSGSQRWAFNYITSVESFINGLFNITPAFYAAEYEKMTFQQINGSVRAFINSTNT